MAFLKTFACHGRFSNAFYYLHYGCRSASEIEMLGAKAARRDLAVDARGVSGIVDASMPSLTRWCDQMQESYDLYAATHRAPPKGRPRTFYHFVVSPDPSDGASLAQVRSLCNAWLDASFPGSEAVIVYHDDNSEREQRGLPGIVHGHIIVSAVAPDLDSKVQISDATMDALTDRLQELAPSFGMSAFAHDEGRAYKRKKHDPQRHGDPQRCGAERAIATRDGTSWKEDVRELVSATIPFCTDFHDLRRHLAPYGFGAERIKGGLLFVTPEGRKVGSNHLGVGFQEYRLARFFRPDSFIAQDARQSSFRDGMRHRANMLSRTNPELLRLQETLDALGTMEREGIDSMESFASAQTDLKALAAKERVRLLADRKRLDDAGELLQHAFALKAYADVAARYEALPAGPERTEFFAAHVREIQARDAALAHLDANGIAESDALSMLERYAPLAESYLDEQARMDGTAQRIADIRQARYVAQRIMSASLMRENEERAALGLPPKMPPATKAKAPVRTYPNAKTAPYWNVNIKKATYARIKAANRLARLNLAKLSPDHHMPPYLKRQDQIERSMAHQMHEGQAQERRHAEQGARNTRKNPGCR